MKLCRRCRQFVGHNQSFSLDEETIQQICSNPDPETAFNVMVRRRRAEVQVSTLSAEQKREFVKAKDKELSTFCQVFCGRGGITFKDDGFVKARLVVQSFTDQRLGKIPTSSPTASRRRITGFPNSQTQNVHFFRETWTSNVWTTMTMMTISKIESAQPVSDTFCEPIPELSRKLQLEHHECIRLLKAVYGLVNAPRRWYHRVATDLRNVKGEESVMEPCLWTIRDEYGVIHALCLVYVDYPMLACSDFPFGKHVFDGIDNLYDLGKVGVTSVRIVWRTTHSSKQ